MRVFLYFIAILIIKSGYGQNSIIQQPKGLEFSRALQRVYIDSNLLISSLVPLGTQYFTIDFYEIKLLSEANQIILRGKFCYRSASPDCFGLSWVSLFLAKRKNSQLVNCAELKNVLNIEDVENGLFDVQIGIKGNKKLYFYIPYFMSFQLDIKQLKKELRKEVRNMR
jgi:hypothetical protein